MCLFKCILGDCDVIHDVLPDPFRMHDKNRPKGNIPSSALHPPWQLDPETGPCWCFAVRFPGVSWFLGVGRAENYPSEVHSCYPARAGL